MMNSPPETRLLGILRHDDELVVPLSRVRGRMEPSPECVADDSALISCLQRRPDLFVLLAHERRAPGYDAWPAELRFEYAEVLENGSASKEGHVALRETLVTRRAAGDGLVLQVQRTLLQLWGDQDDGVRSEVAKALEILDGLHDGSV